MAYIVKPAAIAVRASIAGRYLAREDTAFDVEEDIFPYFLKIVVGLFRGRACVFVGAGCGTGLWL